MSTYNLKKDDFIQSLEYYDRLVSDLQHLEPEEILLMQSERDEIYDSSLAMKKSNTWSDVFAKRLREIDEKLLSSKSLASASAKVAKKALDENRHIDNTRWWWDLDRLKSLNSEEKSALV